MLDNVRLGAQNHGRAYGVMYDLSGMRNGSIGAVMDDWKGILDRTQATSDPQYIRHNGKPVVSVWGIGFPDGRDALLEDSLQLIDFLKNDPIYGGNAVKIGVPPEWRWLDTPEIPNAVMLQVAQAADIVSPWSVGRFDTPAGAQQFAENVWKPDIAWCQEHNVEYMPVVFPGFSWHNLRRGKTPLNQIPRLGGRFLWTQFAEAKKLGATMVYQAMFDEVDEATAIFKCTNNVPVSENGTEFLTYEGLPSDFYLRLVGEASQLVRGEIGLEDEKLIV